MRRLVKRYPVLHKFALAGIFLLQFIDYSFSQHQIENDTLLKISGGSFLKVENNKFFIKSDTTIVLSPHLVNVSLTDNKTIAFYDSLRSKASRSKLTRIIYDMIIISPDSADPHKIKTRSDENFLSYSGLRIRSITIRQVDVFGGNIYNPASPITNRLERFLNHTHINTNEKIIRRNLLFREGDTISPLRISDNERIIRQLPYIDDARILIVPVSDEEADIIIITKDVYSLGGDLTIRSKTSGSIWIFDKNIFGMGHEIKLEIPYSSSFSDSPGLGISYYINNIAKSFVNLDLNYYDGPGKNSYGFRLYRNLLGSEMKYAFGISVNRTETFHDLDTLLVLEPLKYNFQDYWFLRSFMVDPVSVSRIIAGVRYINNNVFRKPEILPDSHYELQRYRLYLGTIAYSMQKFYKTSLIYSYGRTEDIPYGGLVRITVGLEDNEFKKRNYTSADVSAGFSAGNLGYFHLSAAAGTFLNHGKPEQGVFSYNLNYFTNLFSAGKLMIRNFLHVNYTGGFKRYLDEYLTVPKKYGFSSFENDSLKGTRRLNMGVESVLFNPINFFGFRFAFFGFSDLVVVGGINNNNFLSGHKGIMLGCIGAGLRIRNDNMVFRTFQIRVGYYPYLPAFSESSIFVVSGEQLLRPGNFDPGPPGLLPYN